MDAFGMLLSGFVHALSPEHLLMAALGALVGTFVGVLPGLGPTSAIAILLPFTAVLGPTEGIIMLAGIYYGAMYGGSTTAILLNIPGEVSSVPTCLDGHPMARKGRGGAALGVAAIASFAAGTMSVVGLVLFAPVLANQALKFGPPEYFALMLLAFTVILNLSGDTWKAMAMGAVGVLLSLVGIGSFSGMPRFAYGSGSLSGGLEMIAVIIGLFSIAEVFRGIEEKRVSIAPGSVKSVYPTREDLKRSAPAFVRGGLVGFVLGLLPGCSAAVSSFLAYDLEKKVSKRPESFGKGAVEGVAAPEAANNATSSAGFIPLFALGIPSSPPLAILLAGLMIYGLTPGPVLFTQHADFAWTVIASMFVGNLMLLVLNLPLVGMWTRLTRVPFGIMAPLILLLSIIGAYTVRNSLFDVMTAFVFGALGFYFHKYRWPVLPLVLGFILGPLVEKSFLQSMAMSNGRASIFFERPITVTLFVAAGFLVFISLRLRKRTKQRVREESAEHLEIA